MYILLLLLFMGDPKPITIVVNDNRESRLMIQDFKIDWEEKLEGKVPARFAEIQRKLKPRITFVDIRSLDSKVLKYSRFDKYPTILYGEYGLEPEYLPDEAYYTRSFPLLSLETFVNKIEFDYKSYQELRDKAESDAGTEYELWLRTNKPAEFQNFIQSFYDEEWYMYPGYTEFYQKFSKIPGIPVFKPKYPIRPRIWYPWEKEYSLFDSYEKYERKVD